ncbi:MAG: hypothetical protein M1829_001861 [Trizodia sp. TS-e1964]|nr:MAG: hypothetical protein M1829_001861 [Trizodia sp. TS-e1964]
MRCQCLFQTLAFLGLTQRISARPLLDGDFEAIGVEHLKPVHCEGPIYVLKDGSSLPGCLQARGEYWDDAETYECPDFRVGVGFEKTPRIRKFCRSAWLYVFHLILTSLALAFVMMSVAVYLESKVTSDVEYCALDRRGHFACTSKRADIPTNLELAPPEKWPPGYKSFQNSVTKNAKFALRAEKDLISVLGAGVVLPEPAPEESEAIAPQSTPASVESGVETMSEEVYSIVCKRQDRVPNVIEKFSRWVSKFGS